MKKIVVLLISVSIIVLSIRCNKNSTGPKESKIYNIVYESRGQNTFQIKSVNSDGSNKQTLIDTLYCGHPDLSPDAMNMVYLAGNPADLYIFNLKNSSTLQLTHTQNIERLPIFSPDGKIIAYLQDYDLYLINLDGSNKRFLCEIGQDYSQHQFSPDGQTLVYTKNQNIWLINMDGTNNRLLHESIVDTTHYPIYNPVFSPDAQLIFFEEARIYTVQTLQIFSIDSEGRNKKQLTEAGSNHDFCLSRDGTKVLFCSDRDGNYEIYLMDVDGSNQINLSQSPLYEEAPSFSPDGNYITFVSKVTASQNGDIYFMSVNGNQKVNISKEPENDNLRPIFKPVL
jgi:Tol biopolymer transport system component